MTVSLVTLLWRNEAYAAAFAKSLLEARRKAQADLELIAVVNGPDGDPAAEALAAALAGSAQRVRFVRLERNAGFTGGANRGCDAATGSPLIVANLDLEFDPGFFQVLEQSRGLLATTALLAPGVSPARFSDGDPVELGALRRDFMHRPRLAARVPAGVERVAAGNGCCLVLNRAAWQLRIATEGQFLPEVYHSYYEDVELFWWAARSQVPVWFVPTMRVVHHQGGSFGGRFRFVERSPELQSSILANYRLTFYQHVAVPSEVAGWLAGELGYVTLLVRGAGTRGLRTYARSWAQTARRGRRLRQLRGGRIRPDIRDVGPR